MRLTIAQITEYSQALTIVPARDAHRVIQRISWDSRTMLPDTLFVALPGEHVDGNDFIIEALRRGAAAVLASRQVTEEERFTAQRHRVALLYVTDGVAALQRLASAWRDELGARVIGITGSSGKTSTKSYVAAVLEKAFLTVSSLGNRNNEIGLPATVLSASPPTEALVVEMAMRGLGQIEELCAIARPHVGIVTNIGPVHLEALGTKDNVARAKAELIEALPNSRGIAILNGDDPWTPRIREIAQTTERDVRVILFGLGVHNDIRAAHVTYDEDGYPSFDLWLQDGSPHRVSLDQRGEHSVYNALAGAATGIALGMESQLVSSALEKVQPVAMRQVSHELSDGTLLIDDTYNANPDSMRAALELLAKLSTTRTHVAVLGDMGELGEEEYALHEGIGNTAYLTGVDMLVTIGELARHYAQGARLAGMADEHIFSCDSVEEALGVLVPLRQEAPIVLVKASRFMALERVVEKLIEGFVPVIPDADEQDQGDAEQDAPEQGTTEQDAGETGFDELAEGAPA
ncbi:MAG: UDP-N-acetylmuramoyl-tripeptide--D-alanyl-D-alanine ligase [Coriobacteriales bacterium]|jgi:UDP-N-acetylmuramoyl-tripeptide--D-alanyl-D-alanine ligase|nr:UDP-N-acetylmuramoyl-tripeptide--D-alanyl-D-alanine ligase [Coriobacteriales bacterium]